MAEIANVVVGTFGTKIVLTMVDANGVVVDVSAYDGTLTVKFRKPDSAETQTFTLTFDSDGIDGKLKFTPVTGEIDKVGEWDGTVNLTNVAITIIARSAPFIMEVKKSYA